MGQQPTKRKKRSRKCPHNPRNIEVQEQPEQESQRQSEPEQESQQQLKPDSETETEQEAVVPKPADDSETEPEPESQPADDLLSLYSIGDNVLARYKGRWYLTHFSNLLGNGLISVYFPSDAVTKNVGPHEVRPYQGVQQPTRADMLNKTFEFEGEHEL